MREIKVKEGMPRKGWNTVDIIDHKTISYTCELCGTKIRHEHIISHPNWPHTVSAGCVCAEILSQDYVWRNREKWKANSNSNISITYLKIKHSKIDPVIVNDNGAYSWFIYNEKTGDTYDSRLIDCYYETELEAKDDLFAILEDAGWL